MLKYKDYFGEVIFDVETKVLHGTVLGLKDVITFQGTTVNELGDAFTDSVDDYINWCKERGQEPEKSCSGNIRIIIPPDLHEKLAQESIAKGVSLNSLIIDKLQKK